MPCRKMGANYAFCKYLTYCSMHALTTLLELILGKSNGKKCQIFAKSVICSHFSTWHTRDLLQVTLIAMLLLSVTLLHKATTFSYLNHSRKTWACTESVLEHLQWFVQIQMKLKE